MEHNVLNIENVEIEKRIKKFQKKRLVVYILNSNNVQYV